jgi:hypothetical protein
VAHRVGHGLQDHAVLVGLGEDGRDDALAEGAVQRVVNGRGGDAQARGRVAVTLMKAAAPLAPASDAHVAPLVSCLQRCST